MSWEVAILGLPLSTVLQYVGEIHVPMANNFLGRNLWGRKGPQKKLKDHKIQLQIHLHSSLPSFPSIGCSQRPYKTAFAAAEYCTPVHPLDHQLHLGSTLEPDSEVSKGQHHANSTKHQIQQQPGP